MGRRDSVAAIMRKNLSNVFREQASVNRSLAFGWFGCLFFGLRRTVPFETTPQEIAKCLKLVWKTRRSAAGSTKGDVILLGILDLV
mmetsp:Transcript_8169/g.21679  ORF Transcript_8169/g.21679 Transcript_8169/m.21679 type:complete len:86 (-) Transcript_8169:109-366(-)